MDVTGAGAAHLATTFPDRKSHTHRCGEVVPTYMTNGLLLPLLLLLVLSAAATAVEPPRCAAFRAEGDLLAASRACPFVRAQLRCSFASSSAGPPAMAPLVSPSSRCPHAVVFPLPLFGPCNPPQSGHSRPPSRPSTAPTGHKIPTHPRSLGRIATAETSCVAGERGEFPHLFGSFAKWHAMESMHALVGEG